MQTRTLGLPGAALARQARRHEPHVAALNALADRIAAEVGHWTPSFDPDSGGIRARVLLLLESPGPQASHSGFVSLDNPSQTAENLTCLLKLSGLHRSGVLLWNTVPWQLSAGGVVTPTDAQLEQAAPYTVRLLELLSELRAVVLVGLRAQRGWPYVVGRLASPPPTLNCPHPSPQNFAARPQQAARAIEALAEATALARRKP